MAEPVFEKVSTHLDFPKEEQEVLRLWKELRVFERSLAESEGKPTFVFYEGPPTANGLPHNGHVLTRVIKDLFPRYKTMRGYHVPRKAGWDTHGLPVEVEVEKELRIHGKAAIEQYGVEPFIAKCVASVFRYTKEWEHLTERVGFWVDLPAAYVTYHRDYVESVWWALSELFNKGLLYQGHKVVWWWAQGGTALSSAEVGLGYKQVDDPSVYVAFPLVDEPDVSLLVWTTTPWTLPSNAYAAVHPAFEYVRLKTPDKTLIVAKDLAPALCKKLKSPYEVTGSMKGSDIVGKRYRPPFDVYWDGLKDVVVGRKDGTFVSPYWRVIPAGFVTLDAGTGIVHVAPAFGEDDFSAHRAELTQLTNPAALQLLCAVKPDGTFVPELERYAGRWVKDCDKEITHELKERGLLVHAETYRHDYPFCWRADSDPLIQYARPAWYIKTTASIDAAIANNRAVNWLPEHIKDGRMGDFLANNVDWALSRERYWGTPLNVWVCDKESAHKRSPSSVAEIEKVNAHAFDHFHAARAKDPTLSEHLIVHKPWIDSVTFPCPTCGGSMRRVPEVIDAWFDSGSMPFAQWGFPHKGHEQWKRQFPADFISEAIDQTRGWFYSLLMISTLVFDEDCQKRFGLDPPRAFPHPYKTCIVLGHVSDKEGKKESKSKGNYTPPEIILDEVKMDFAVLGPGWQDSFSDLQLATMFKGVSIAEPELGTGYIAPEDLEGLDLVAPADVEAMGPKGKRALRLHAVKGLPRRVVLLADADATELGARPTKTPNVKPVEVPRLPEDERVTLRDPRTPAPGADAFRWFFYASNPPWNATRHSLSNVRALQKEFLVKLRNVYSFFTIYANIDGEAPPGQRLKQNDLDRWILSELSLTTRSVTQRLDAYDIYGATQALTAFVDALSNWYVRRSRDRFWRSGWDEDKAGAHSTLYEVLVTIAKLIAPFTPFMAERMYQNLVVRLSQAKGVQVPPSVHLERFPEVEQTRIDEQLSKKMSAVRDLVSLGLQVRTNAKIKVRQPLRTAYIVMLDHGVLSGFDDLLREELNVISFRPVDLEHAEQFVEYRLKPNFRTLGQRGLGKQAQELKKVMIAMPAAEASRIATELLENGTTTVAGTALERVDVEIEFVAKEGFAAAGDRVGVVVLDTKLDDDLRERGLAREIQNRVQTARKEMGLEYTDRIRVAVLGAERIMKAVAAHGPEIAREVLAVDGVATDRAPAGAIVHAVDVEGERVEICVARA